MRRIYYLIFGILLLALLLLAIYLLPVFDMDSEAESAEKQSDLQTTPDNEDIAMTTTVFEILERNPYRAEEIIGEAMPTVRQIASDIPEFKSWLGCDVTDFRFLHSVESGLVSYAFMEFGDSGKTCGYFVWNCETHEPVTFSAGGSPIPDVRKEHSDETVYYFLSPPLIGYGIVNESGTLDLYRCCDDEKEVIRNITFS